MQKKGNSLACPFENVLWRNVLDFFVLPYNIYMWGRKTEDILSEDIFERTF